MGTLRSGCCPAFTRGRTASTSGCCVLSLGARRRGRRVWDAGRTQRIDFTQMICRRHSVNAILPSSRRWQRKVQKSHRRVR